jgi:hypothetical protein
METIREIIQGYHTINKSRKNSYWYTNVYENIQHYLTIIDYVEKHIEPLENALTTYIESKPNILQQWIQYGLQDMTKHLTMRDCSYLLPDMKEHWPLFFKEDTFEEYEISYEKALETIKIIQTKGYVYNCDDPDILAIHKNKPCDCMYMCSLCEEIGELWYKKIEKMYSRPMNIFLHKEHQAPFLEKWLTQHPTYSEFQWPPTKIYFQRYETWECKRITDFAEMCEYVKERRKNYKKGGKTPLQCYHELCYDIQGLFNYIDSTESDITIFMKLWNQIEIVPLWIRYEKQRCKEILKML